MKNAPLHTARTELRAALAAFKSAKRMYQQAQRNPHYAYHRKLAWSAYNKTRARLQKAMEQTLKALFGEVTA